MLVVYSSKYLLIVHSQPHTYTQVANSFLPYSQTPFSQNIFSLRFVKNKLAKLQATLVQNYDSLTDLLTGMGEV